ncbi:DNA polymerase III, subunit gamma and tau [Candidatus Saccharibacteria bacterium 32-49-12]|nr:MAG: DNA polymerase III, subunit gamma and tau [Candidatus Saccharibacteria bacterium 32-49-12]
MSRALYRKYRSKSLDEVVGQRHITDVLTKALESGRISHAYLFTGPRGVGKTSVARILAHAITQLPYDEAATNLDIIEIDAASNNGVEDVRNLREKVQIAPVSASKKIYIIDEVHMLSKPAFNALLKTLEEPPAHVVFILATTDLDKLPATIVSRTQRYGFRAIEPSDAVVHLKKIAKSEKIKIDDEALALIADRADGSFRDGISLLDQVAGLADGKKSISASDVELALGLAPKSLISDIITYLKNLDTEAIVNSLTNARSQGLSPLTLASQLAQSLTELSTEHPEFFDVIDQLLDVNRSSQPHLKLLSVLGRASHNPKPSKNVALSSPVKEVSATIASLAKQATRKKPVDPPDEVPIGIKELPAVEPADFDWDKLLDYVKENFVALYSVLNKCKPELDGAILKLYTGNAFYKKKLDDSKYSPLLYQSLQQIGCADLAIETIPRVAPPKSSQAASVVAIMGGGEEVNLEAEATKPATA